MNKPGLKLQAVSGKRTLVMAAFLLLASGCAVHSGLEMPEPAVPEQWENQLADSRAAVDTPAWWQGFGSDELNRLVARAFSSASPQELRAAMGLLAGHQRPAAEPLHWVSSSDMGFGDGVVGVRAGAPAQGPADDDLRRVPTDPTEVAEAKRRLGEWVDVQERATANTPELPHEPPEPQGAADAGAAAVATPATG